ncbi:MAG TPA: hypothetical protein PK517_06070 [Nitrosomonas sp.]|nr:hypothetical protein [Nitrosomonas sp.]
MVGFELTAFLKRGEITDKILFAWFFAVSVLISTFAHAVTYTAIDLGWGQSILDRREKIKRRTLALRRQLFYANKSINTIPMS